MNCLIRVYCGHIFDKIGWSGEYFKEIKTSLSNIIRETFTGIVGRQLSCWYKEHLDSDRCVFCWIGNNSFILFQKTSKRRCEIVKRVMFLLQTVDKCYEAKQIIFIYDCAVWKSVKSIQTPRTYQHQIIFQDDDIEVSLSLDSSATSNIIIQKLKDPQLIVLFPAF